MTPSCSRRAARICTMLDKPDWFPPGVTPIHLGISSPCPNGTFAFEAGRRVTADLVERPAWRPPP